MILRGDGIGVMIFGLNGNLCRFNHLNIILYNIIIYIVMTQTVDKPKCGPERPK